MRVMRIPLAVRFLLLLAIGLSAFAIFWISLGISLDRVRALADSVGIVVLLVAVVFDVLNILSYGSAWYFLVHTVQPRARIRKCIQGVMVAIFGDIMIPTASVTGETLRITFAKKEFNLPYPDGLATTLVHRVLNVFAFMGILGLSSLVLLFQGGLNPGLRLEVSVLFLIVLVPAVLGIAVFFRPTIATSIVSKLAGRFAEHPRTSKFVQRLMEWMRDFEKSMAIIRTRSRTVLIAFVFLIFQWLFQILVPYAFLVGVSLTLGHSVNYWTYFWLVALAFPLYGLVNLMPIGIPAMAGLLDSAMAGTFIVLGFSPEVAITTTLLTRVVIVLFESSLTGAVTILTGYQGFLRDRKDIVQATL